MAVAQQQKPQQHQNEVQRTTTQQTAAAASGDHAKPPANTSTTPAHTAALLGGTSAADAAFATIEKKDKNNTAKLGTDVGNLVAQHLGNNDTKDTSYDEQLLADANKHGALAQSLDRAGNIAMGPGQYQALTSDVAGAVDKGSIKGTDVINAAKKDSKNSEANIAADVVTQKAAAAVDAARGNYEAAVDHKKALDEELAIEVGKVSAGLTGDQLKQFEAKFKADHGYNAAQAAIDKQATNLDNTLTKDLPTLEAAAKDPPKVEGPAEDAKLATDSAMGALADLADSNKAFDAIKKSTDLMKDPTLAKAMASADGGNYKDNMNKVIGEGLPRVAAQLMKEQKEGGEADAKTKEQILGIAENLEKGIEVTDRSADGIQAINALKAYWNPSPATQKQLDAKQKVMNTSNGEVTTAQKKVDDLESDIRIAKATGDKDKKLAGYEHELAAAQTELHTAQGEATEAADKYYELKRLPLENLEKYATTGESGGMKKALGVIGMMDYASDPKASLQAISKVLYDGGDASRVRAIEIMNDGTRGLGLAGRLVPMAGMAASGMAMIEDWNSGSAGGKVSAAGDFLSMIGGGLEATGTVGDIPGAAIGTVLDAVGIGVSLIGDAMGKGDPVADDTTKRLQSMGVDKNLASGLGHSNVGVMSQLTKMGVNRSQIDSEARNSPNLLSNKREFDELHQDQNALHVKPGDWDQMVQTMVKDEQKRVGGDSQYASLELGAQIDQDQVAAGRYAGMELEGSSLRGAQRVAKEQQLEDKYLASALDAQFRDLKNVK